MENIRDIIAQKHEYADFAQVSMTDRDQFEKTEIERDILNECVDELQKELNRKFAEWENQRQLLAKYHGIFDKLKINLSESIELIDGK